MSVRLASADSDSLDTTTPTDFGIGTGVFSMGGWIKLISDLDAVSNFMLIWDNVDSNPYVQLYSGSDGTTPTVGAQDASSVGASSGSFSTTVWVWAVVGRNSSNELRIRIFDDSTSNTPTSDTASATSPWTTDLTDMDELIVGYRGSQPIDAEVTNLKLHAGAYWTDAEARTEALYYGMQKTGGTRYCWKLKDVDADADGLNEFHGTSNHNLANTGCVNGASDPTNLSELTAAGGGRLVGNSLAGGSILTHNFLAGA